MLVGSTFDSSVHLSSQNRTQTEAWTTRFVMERGMLADFTCKGT